jgi:hypothetical protein
VAEDTVERAIADLKELMREAEENGLMLLARQLSRIIESIDSLISAVHAKGVAEERERIRKLGTLHDKGNGYPFYSVVASVLAPKEKP